MDRRGFITLVAGGIFLTPRRLFSEHHLVSAEPLLTVFDLSSFVDQYTTVEDFYVRDHYAAPQNLEANLLRIEGEVEDPKQLTMEHLSGLPKREIGAVLECAGNTVGTMGEVSNGLWKGWSLGEVLSLAHPKPSGAYVHLLGRDGYARSVAIERVHSDGMLVTHLNRRPLSRNHGAPWRALFLGWYGMDSVKWLGRIVVSTSDLPTEDGQYVELTAGPSGQIDRRPLPRIQVKSLIISPTSGAVLRRGSAEVRGLAWSGEGKISKVEVSADGGETWQTAEFQPPTRYEWTFWRAPLKLSQRGAAELVCRATDGKGFSQPLVRDRSRLDGYANNWYHRVRCVVA